MIKHIFIQHDPTLIPVEVIKSVIHDLYEVLPIIEVSSTYPIIAVIDVPEVPEWINKVQ